MQMKGESFQQMMLEKLHIHIHKKGDGMDTYTKYWVGQKSSFGFLSKSRRQIFFFFIFTMNFNEQWYSLFCLTIFWYFSVNFIILSSPNFFILLSKELFQETFTVFQGIEVFTIKRFV